MHHVDRSVSDELLAAALRDATTQLNAALLAASNAGLKAKVAVDSRWVVASAAEIQFIVSTSVSRAL